MMSMNSDILGYQILAVLSSNEELPDFEIAIKVEAFSKRKMVIGVIELLQTIDDLLSKGWVEVAGKRPVPFLNQEPVLMAFYRITPLGSQMAKEGGKIILLIRKKKKDKAVIRNSRLLAFSFLIAALIAIPLTSELIAAMKILFVFSFLCLALICWFRGDLIEDESVSVRGNGNKSHNDKDDAGGHS